MKKFIIITLVLTLLLACGKEEKENDNRIKVVATNSIAADLIQNIVKDKADVYSMVPEGQDPHMYEPLPKDIDAVMNADIIFYNGFNLETGGGWFDDLIKVTDKSKDVFRLTRDVEAIYLSSSETELSEDPHAWLDVSNAIKYIDVILEEIIILDPINSEYYLNNHSEYLEELVLLNDYAKEKLSEVSISDRILVTSEGAFKYFAKAYDFNAQYIWEINTDNQGTPEQMNRILSIIKENKVKALFTESSLSPKTMEMVSYETKINIASTLFTDSLAKKGSEGDTYITMMRWNIDKISEALK